MLAMFPGLMVQRPKASVPRHEEEIHSPGGLVLTADPKPRLRWTTDLHDRFIDAVAQLGGSEKATPKTIMRTMGVKGLTLFHLKSHLQKYRLGKLSGKDMAEQSKDASYLLEASSSGALSPRASASDVKEGLEVKEALRAQMEMQRRLHEQVEVQKHVQIRVEAYHKYIDSLLEKAYKIASEQITSADAATTRGMMCAPSDPLSSSEFQQLSGGANGLRSLEETRSNSRAIEEHIFYRKPPKLS